VHAPDEKAVRAHIHDVVEYALHNYAWSLRDNATLADHKVAHWSVLPMTKGAYYLPYEEWRHAEYQFPMKISVADQAGKPWYSFEFTQFRPNAASPAENFNFTFPENAVVFDWDLDDTAISLNDARKTMNFTVREPTRLPEGHRVHKIVRAHGQIPMLAMLMDQGAAWLSLTQNRYTGRGAYQLPVGRPVQIGRAKGFANFFAGSTTLNWMLDGTELTLVGNLPFPQMMEIAAGVK
jgi:hypothetical protein